MNIILWVMCTTLFVAPILISPEVVFDFFESNFTVYFLFVYTYTYFILTTLLFVIVWWFKRNVSPPSKKESVLLGRFMVLGYLLLGFAGWLHASTCGWLCGIYGAMISFPFGLQLKRLIGEMGFPYELLEFTAATISAISTILIAYWTPRLFYKLFFLLQKNKV